MNIKKLLDKDDLSMYDYMNVLLEASASSSQFGYIVEYEKEKTYRTRANINVLIALPLGAGKTTQLVSIDGAEYVNDTTLPGIVGTINKEGVLVEGAVLRSAGKLLVLDEFNRVSNEVKEALNLLLEQQWYSRNLGFKLSRNRPIDSKRKFSGVYAKGNILKVWCRFSCIASTMFLKRKKDYIDKAWFTRFIPIRFLPGYDYYRKLAKGEVYLKINPRVKHIEEFYFYDYLEACDFFWDWFLKSKYKRYFDKNPLEQGAINRIMQDLIRLSAYWVSLDDKCEIELDDFKFIKERLAEFIFNNYIYWNLTEEEEKLLRLIGKYSQSEIATMLEKDPAWVSRKIAYFIETGYIKRYASQRAYKPSGKGGV